MKITKIKTKLHKKKGLFKQFQNKKNKRSKNRITTIKAIIKSKIKSLVKTRKIRKDFKERLKTKQMKQKLII